MDIIENIGYDFDKTEKSIPYFVKLMLAVRAREIDEKIKEFIKRFPGAVIVNLGSGLDTAFYRVDNGSIRWLDVDLPEVIRIREELLPETGRSRYISGSIFEKKWLDEIPRCESGILFVSAGVLPYFNENLVKMLFKNIMDNFPECDIVFDTQSGIGNMVSNIGTFFRGMKSATLRWGIKDAALMEKWHGGMELLEQYPLFSRIKREPSWGKNIIRIIDASDKFRMSNIVHLKLKNKKDN